MRYLCIVFFLFFCSKNTRGHVSASEFSADSIDMYKLKFEKLNEFGRFNSIELKGYPSIWILFQPNCASCESQFKDLACLADTIPLLAVGIKGSKEKLIRSMQFVKFDGSKLIASQEFDKRINPKGTPTLLIVNKSGYVKKTLVGIN